MHEGTSWIKRKGTLLTGDRPHPPRIVDVISFDALIGGEVPDYDTYRELCGGEYGE